MGCSSSNANVVKPVPPSNPSNAPNDSSAPTTAPSDSSKTSSSNDSEEELQVQSAFKKFDKDGSGSIDLNEGKTAIKELGDEAGVTVTDEQVKAIFKAVDQNGDGKLSLEEFKKLCTIRFIGARVEASQSSNPSSEAPSSAPPADSDSFSARIGQAALNFTNEFRKQNGLEAVKWNDDIHASCQNHSELMATDKKGFNHDGFSDRIKALPCSGSAGENIYMCSGKEDNTDENTTALARQAVDGWIKSPGHKRNLLQKSATQCAIGAAYGASDGCVYFTQILIG